MVSLRIYLVRMKGEVRKLTKQNSSMIIIFRHLVGKNSEQLKGGLQTYREENYFLHTKRKKKIAKNFTIP